MSAGVSRTDVKPVELALAIDRGLMGLLICYVFIPRLLQTGRHLIFLTLTAVSLLLLGTFEIYGVARLFHDPDAVRNYRCFFLCSFPVIATMGMVKLSWLVLNQQRQAAIVGQERSDTELRFLRAQMNPHLLLNSLNNVYAYALERSKRAPEMILKLSGVLRYMLYEAGDELVPLKREIDYIRDYFALQKLATEGRGTVTLSICGDPERAAIAPLVLIVLIENCFKHAVETTDSIFVRVSIRIEEDALLLETENNLPASGQSRGAGGIGLENVRRRLELLYPGKYQLDAGEKSGSFQARLRLVLDRQ